jgi:hypothetical protein
MKNSRRQFMIMSAAGACSIALSNTVQAQAMVAETDPQAAALGYVADATKVNKAKFPKYQAGQVGAKKVAGPGWCSAWAKKA